MAIFLAAANAHAFKLQPIEKNVDADKVRSGLGAALQHLEEPFVKSYIDHFSTQIHGARMSDSGAGAEISTFCPSG